MTTATSNFIFQQLIIRDPRLSQPLRQPTPNLILPTNEANYYSSVRFTSSEVDLFVLLALLLLAVSLLLVLHR
jgi:hypothetical protein